MRAVSQVLAFAALASRAAGQSQYVSGAGSQAGYAGGAGGRGGDGGFGSSAEGSLEETIPGVPGEDYPIFAEVPETSFVCDGQVDGGYYADVEGECQPFHICTSDGHGGLTKYSFLCPNGTLFNQQYFVCDWWFNVDCSTAEDFYFLNDEIAADREANSPAGGGQDQYSGSAGGRRSGGPPGRSRGSSGSASAPRGAYSSPSGGGQGDSGFEDTSAGNSYGAPGGAGDFGAAGDYGTPSSSSSSSPLSSAGDYGAPAGYSAGRTARQRTFRSRNGRRNSRGLEEGELLEFLGDQEEASEAA